jgi:hypothetical protein
MHCQQSSALAEIAVHEKRNITNTGSSGFAFEDQQRIP